MKGTLPRAEILDSILKEPMGSRIEIALLNQLLHLHFESWKTHSNVELGDLKQK